LGPTTKPTWTTRVETKWMIRASFKRHSDTKNKVSGVLARNVLRLSSI
jgi:hypothetical protein